MDSEDIFDAKINAAVVALKKEISEIVKVNQQLTEENYELDYRIKQLGKDNETIKGFMERMTDRVSQNALRSAKLEKDFITHSHSMRNGSVVIPAKKDD